ncbi:MAG: hypothetical protein KBB55_01935, partial [Candidatus Buchananbacteria bacterium]|nr:hypothetical protein [Candidatus Buchananbacteria bacterium]
MTIQYYHSPSQRSKARRRWLMAAAVVTPLLMVAGWFVRDAIRPLQAAPGVNQQITYQGKVADDGGLPLTTGSYNFLFLIYTDPSGGTPVWFESWTATTSPGAVSVINGVFTAPLGTSTSMSTIDFNSDSLYLEVRFDADSNGSFEETFTPRKRLTSSPYSFNSDKLDGLTSSDFLSTSTYSAPSIGSIGSSSATTTAAGNFVVTGTTRLASSLTGILRATAGYVTAGLVNLATEVTGILGISNGGTGTATTPTYGQILVGNGSGGYTLTPTSSLGITGGSGTNDWSYDTNFGSAVLTPSSTIPVWFKDEVHVSSTLRVSGSIGETYAATIDSALNPFGLYHTGDFTQSSLGGILSQMNDTSGILSLRSNNAIAGGDSYIGVRGVSILATSTAFNVGVFGYAKNSSLTNAGGYFASNDTDSADYLALLGVTGTVNAGGYFTASSSTAPQNIALVASASGSSGDNIAGYFTDGDVIINDRLAVGTSTPGAVLSVDGSVVFQGTDFATTTIGNLDTYLTFGGYDIGGTKYPMISGMVMGTSAIFLQNATYVIEDPSLNSNPILALSSADGSSSVYLSNSTSTGQLVISSSATTTADRGFDISSGCYAINGTCITTGASQWITSGSDVNYLDGNVGIFNDSSPSLVLGDSNGSDFAGISYDNGGDILSFSGATGGYYFDDDLYVNSTGNITVATGYIEVNTTGSFKQEGITILTGSSTKQMLAVGDSAGQYFDENCWQTTAVGTKSLYNYVCNGVSVGSTALGASALEASDGTGQGNTALGARALLSNVSGSYNTGVGDAVLLNNTGTGNVAVGASALVLSTSADYNVAVGGSALNGGTGANLLTGDYNVALGRAAGSDIVSGSYNIVLGSNLTVVNAATSGQLNIGGAIFGTGMYQNTTLSSSSVANARVGVGTTTPFAKFAVSSVVGETMDLLFQVASSTAGSLFQVDKSGNVGVTGLSTLSGGVLVNTATSTITNLVTGYTTSTSATTSNLYVSSGINLASGIAYSINNASDLSA